MLAQLCVCSLFGGTTIFSGAAPLRVQYSKDSLLGTVSSAWRLNRKRIMLLCRTWHLLGNNINCIHSHSTSGCPGHWSNAPCLWWPAFDICRTVTRIQKALGYGLPFLFLPLHPSCTERDFLHIVVDTPTYKSNPHPYPPFLSKGV